MYLQGSEEFKHHIETYGSHRKFGHKDFIPLFKAEKYDPNYWAQLFKKAGARYVVPVAEHHDGFAMYRLDDDSQGGEKAVPVRIDHYAICPHGTISPMTAQ